jgi:quinoprotein glucose dehydrogenase
MDPNAGGRGGGGGNQAGAMIYQQFCSDCHGANMQNPKPEAPSLVGVTNRLAPDVIRNMITGGGGEMRPVSGITDVQINQLMPYLTAGPGGARGGGAGRGGGGNTTYPAGPIVASGALPTPALPARGGALFGGQGPTGGNVAYPADAADVPTQRYSTGYNVMGAATGPPNSRLVAYDLNTGEIKWQVPTGDDPQTVRAGGPPNTGAIGLRTGIMPTKSGLVFQAGGDGKLRAYDEDTGKILWTGNLGGSGRGVPSIYMAKGRQYLVVVAQAGGGAGGGGRGAAPAAPVDPNQPRGFIAWALPEKK